MNIRKNDILFMRKLKHWQNLIVRVDSVYETIHGFIIGDVVSDVSHYPDLKNKIFKAVSIPLEFLEKNNTRIITNLYYEAEKSQSVH